MEFKEMKIFQVPPRLRVRGVGVPGATPPGARNMPVMVRNRLGGINYPGPNGEPTSGYWPYTERQQWGDGSQGGAPSNTVPPDIGVIPPALSTQQLDVISTPNGQSTRPWTNPTTYAGFPIILADGSTIKILSSNDKRNSLIIQNTSTATAPDVAGTLYVGFNTPPSRSTGSLALAPGLGFFWSAADCPPRDDIYVAFFGTVNGGATVILSGAVIQGTYLQDNEQARITPGGLSPLDYWDRLYGKT
jgi:hypothetical protein